MPHEMTVTYQGQPLRSDDGELLYAVLPDGPGRAVAVPADRPGLVGTFPLIDAKGRPHGRLVAVQFDTRG